MGQGCILESLRKFLSGGLRQEEGGRGAHDGAQAEDEEREDGGVASLANVNCVTKYR